MSAVTMKIIMEVLKKTKNRLAYNPSIPTNQSQLTMGIPAYFSLSQHNSQYTDYGINLGAHQLMNE
jgi:hypothetical protein